MRRQMRRHTSRRSASRRRLGRIWNRLFHRPRARGQIPLLTPSRASQTVLGDGIIRRAGGTSSSPPASSTGPPPVPPETVGQVVRERPPDVSSCTLVTETEPLGSPAPGTAGPTCAAHDLEPRHLNKELRAVGQAEPRKAFRDPLSESAAERLQPQGDTHGTSPPLLSEGPGRLPLRKREPVSSGSSLCPPQTCQEEPLGVHGPTSPHSLLSDASDDESLLVC